MNFKYFINDFNNNDLYYFRSCLIDFQVENKSFHNYQSWLFLIYLSSRVLVASDNIIISKLYGIDFLIKRQDIDVINLNG